MMTSSSKDDYQPRFDELISLSRAAEISGLSHSHLRLLVRDGEIAGRKMGRDWFTTLQAVNEYLARNRRPGPKTTSK
jgi:hypothetical protein